MKEAEATCGVTLYENAAQLVGCLTQGEANRRNDFENETEMIKQFADHVRNGKRLSEMTRLELAMVINETALKKINTVL